jgi:hypothetical protein
MIQPIGARPAPSTTDLLEVLDRALGGGIVIESVGPPSVASLAPAKAARIVVAAFETYLHHAALEPSRSSAVPIIESRRSG